MPSATTDIGTKALYFLAFAVVGLVNATPGFPGYDALVSNISVGISGFTLRKFPYNGLSLIFCADDAECVAETFHVADLV